MSQRWINELGLEAGDIVPTADCRIALTTSEGLSIEQERRVHAAINQWVDGAVLRPDAADKPIWFNDPHWALVSHLKQLGLLEACDLEHSAGERTRRSAGLLVEVLDLSGPELAGGGDGVEKKCHFVAGVGADIDGPAEGFIAAVLAGK